MLGAGGGNWNCTVGLAWAATTSAGPRNVAPACAGASAGTLATAPRPQPELDASKTVNANVER